MNGQRRLNLNPAWRIYGILLAVAVIAADQWSKWYVVTQYLGNSPDKGLLPWLFEKAERAPYSVKPITSFLNIVMVWNPGVSFGMLQADKAVVTWALSAVALAVCIGFLIWLWREPSRFRGVTIGLIVGGALGNVWDRLRFGAVADFIDVHVGGWHWPAFNIADSAITIGVILLLVEIIFFAEGKK